MSPSTSSRLNPAFISPPAAASSAALAAHVLTTGEESEVLSFLSARPVHTVIMASFIRDNGLVSPLNRGTFYGCRDEEGRLVGVALIGHATLVETESDDALAAFARWRLVTSCSALALPSRLSGESSPASRWALAR